MFFARSSQFSYIPLCSRLRITSSVAARGVGLCGVRKFGSTTARRHDQDSSWIKGPSEPPLLAQTIPQFFASIVSEHGSRTAVISRAQQKRLTYAELDAQSNCLANGLQQVGVRKGDRVAVSLGNNIEHAVTTYALFKLGAILVPLNPAFTAAQVISALDHLDAGHLIIGTETNLPFKKPRENITLLSQLLTSLKGERVQSEAVSALKTVTLVDNSEGRIDTSELTALNPYQDLLSGSSDKTVTPDAQIEPHDIANIQFTSGTTSMPKAACLTHKSILNNGFFIGNRMQLSSADIVCCPPPLFHCFGCILGYMATVTHGSAIVFPGEAFNPEASLRAVQEEKATALYGVATMFVAELELLANGTVPYEGFQYLRTGIAAGSSVPSTLMEKLHKTLNLTGLTICYGMTETSPVSCMTKPDDPLEKRLNTVGSLMPHVEAKVVSSTDHDRILPRGEKGELVVSGYLVMKEYWGDERKTRESRIVDKEGRVWMHTGDEALIDGDGYVKITGRIKDLIIRGGENIHPLEVENALFAHPQIAEVSVVGLPDERYGECVAAFVVVHQGVQVSDEETANEQVLTKAKVQAWVKSRLSSHLVPKHVFWVTEYPKTASGKIQKFKLRELGMSWLAKQETARI